MPSLIYQIYIHDFLFDYGSEVTLLSLLSAFLLKFLFFEMEATPQGDNAIL